MALQFDCPHCKANYEVADDLSGKTIMCRLCQKRGQVRSAAGKTMAGSSAVASPGQSRRKFLLIGGGALASLVSIATGAILARRPWKHWNAKPGESSTRRRGGPGRGGDKGDKSDKGPAT